MRPVLLCVVPIATALSLVTPAHAELGSMPTWPSSSAGHATRAIQHASSTSLPYTVNETALASGTVLREYVASGGTVFAVVWHGPQMAPLNTLLGAWFQRYLQGLAATQATTGTYGPATVQQTGLIVHTAGHMGAFTGCAWLPQALPRGVNPDDLQ